MLYFYLGYLMTQDETFGLSHNISFEKILESCDQCPKDFSVKHPTTVMRAIADLEDAVLIKWNAKSRTFELLHITAYDSNEALKAEGKDPKAVWTKAYNFNFSPP